MDFTSVFELVSRTFADQLNGYAVFETASGESLRVDLAINEQWFRATFQDSTGPILVVTPGNITALENGQPVQSESVDTQAALDAWKSQPPITLAPISTGLSQLQATNIQINQIISSLLQITGGGSLAVAFIPTLCWFNAFYPQVPLGKFVANDVTGRVCIRDIAFTAQSVSFGIELSAKCNQIIFVLDTDKQEDGSPPYQFIELTSRTSGTREVEFNINFSAFLNLPEQTVEATIIHAQLKGERGKFEYGKDDKDQYRWNVELTESLQLILKDVFQNYGFQPGASQSINGSITLNIPTARIIKQTLPFKSGATITLDAPAILTNTSLSLALNSATGRDDLIQGFLAPCQLTISKGAYLSDTSDSPALKLTGLEAILSLGSTTFNRKWIDTQFQIIGGKAEQFETSIGETENDRLALKEVAFDISAHFQNQLEPPRSVLHAHQLHLSTKQGKLSLILKIVNDDQPKEPDAKPDQPLKLKFENQEAGKQAVNIFAQDFISVTNSNTFNTAKRVEVRIDQAATEEPIQKLQVLKWYRLTNDSLAQLRRKIGGKQIVPEEVINKFKDKLLKEKFDSLEDLSKELSKLISKSELNSFGKKITDASFQETFLRSISASLKNFYFQGSLIESISFKSELFGLLTATSTQFNFTQIEGIDIDKLSNLGEVGSVKTSDSYEVKNIQLTLPAKNFSAEAGGIVQRFETVDVDLDSKTKIKIPKPEDGRQNLIRLTYIPASFGKESITAQLSVPKAKLVIQEQDKSLDLYDIQIGLLRESIAPNLPKNLRGFLSQTDILFRIAAKLPTISFSDGIRERYSLERIDEIFDFYKKLLDKAGMPPVADEAFDKVRQAIKHSGDFGSVLKDFKILDIGLFIQTFPITAGVNRDFSEDLQIALGIEAQLPKIGIYLKYKYTKVVTLDKFPWIKLEKVETEVEPLLEVLTDATLKLIVIFSFEFNATTRQVNFIDVETFLLVGGGKTLINDVLTTLQVAILRLILQTDNIREVLLKEINRRFDVSLPDNWNIALAQIKFNKKDTLSLSIDASEKDWNDL
jgi:hypothetical protein